MDKDQPNMTPIAAPIPGGCSLCSQVFKKGAATYFTLAPDKSLLTLCTRHAAFIADHFGYGQGPDKDVVDAITPPKRGRRAKATK